jgi:DNA-binding transcriptional MerR regulator
MRIGELSRRTGVSVRLLRYYEEQGLLTPSRRPSGYREYASGDEERVRQIRVLLAAGLSTARIGHALPGVCTDGDRLVPCPGLVSDLERERARIDEAIRALRASRQVLDSVISAAPRAAPREDPPQQQAGYGGRLSGSKKCHIPTFRLPAP